MRNRFCLFILLLLLFIPVQVVFSETMQVPFIPQVSNYAASEYMAGKQNWAVAQNKQGVIYIGNHKGLMQFDGKRWLLWPLPNDRPVRSVHVSEDGRIYVGSFEQFGYFEADENNELQYNILSDSVLSEMRPNDEFWSIREHRGSLYFQSFSSYFTYDGKRVERGDCPWTPLFFFTAGDALYAQFIQGYFSRLEDGVFKDVLSPAQLHNDHVIAVLPYDEQLMLITASHGPFLFDGENLRPWNIGVRDQLANATCNRAILTKDSCYIIGTISDGVYALDKKGKLLWHLNRDNVLKNNTVLAIFEDANENVWLGLDNGCAYIRKNSPISLYRPTGVDVGMVYDIYKDRDHSYLATNQGVFSLSGEFGTPALIPGTEEQSWFVSKIGRQVLVGHNKGVMKIRNGKAELIPGTHAGGMFYRICKLHGQSVLLVQSYAALNVFLKGEDDQWTFSHVIRDFNHRIKEIEVDAAGNIWATRVYSGMYRIRLDETLRNINDISFYPTLNPDHEERLINVMQLRGRVIFSDGEAFYTYEDLEDRIIPYDLLNTDFGYLADSYRITPVNDQLYWFIRDNEYNLLKYEENSFRLIYTLPMALFEDAPIEKQGHIFRDAEGVCYFNLNGGLGRFDLRKNLSLPEQPELFVSGVKMSGPKQTEPISLPVGSDPNRRFPDYRYNMIQIDLSYPHFSEQEVSVWSRLKGFDENWVRQEGNLKVSYSNLNYGSYLFEAEVRDSKGNILTRTAYPFVINKPVYLSWWAVLLYMFVTGVALTALIRFYTRREVEKRNRQIEIESRLQEQQLKVQEQLIVKLEKEKLEDQLTYKSKELASATLTLISYDDFLKGLKKEMQEQVLKSTSSKKFFHAVIRQIEERLIKEDEWSVYQRNFDQIHHDFFRNLKERYPDLTAGDLRLCAFLRLNMPTKDMARFQNVSIRGIEAARYRVRKKLNLNEGDNLVEFMINFQ